MPKEMRDGVIASTRLDVVRHLGMPRNRHEVRRAEHFVRRALRRAERAYRRSGVGR